MGINVTKEIDGGTANVTYWRIEPEHFKDQGDGTMLFVMMGYIEKAGSGSADRPATRARHARSFIMPLGGRQIADVPRPELYEWAKAHVKPDGFFDGAIDS